MEFNYVRQEQKKGCVAACVAMITGQTYRQVALSFDTDFDADGVEFHHGRAYVCDRGFAALEVTSFGHADVRTSNERMLKPFADIHLVAAKPCVNSHFLHAVVMGSKGQLFDPELPGHNPTEKDYYQIESVIGFFRHAQMQRRKKNK